MIYPIQALDGRVAIPPSKSHAQRVLACALMSKGATTITGLGRSDDELAALGVLQASSAEVMITKDEVKIAAGDKASFPSGRVSFGESGLSSRMFTPILANATQQLELNGKGSLVKRPMNLFDEVFQHLEVRFQSKEGTLPFKISGPLVPKSITLDGSLSSQFITGFIYAYAGNERTRNEVITVENPASIPYIELSLDVLEEFGVSLVFENNRIVFDGPYVFKDAVVEIEGDWSSASFVLVAAAIYGSVRVSNLNKKSKQADIAVLKALEEMGAEVRWDENELVVVSKALRSFEFDATHCPDLFPPLAVLGSYGTGVSKIKGVSRLFSKESDRAATITEELSKLGGRFEIQGDTMFIHPKGEPRLFTVSSRKDHRIAMASAIFALGLPAPVNITDADAVSKSFPDFYTCLAQLTK